MFGRWKQRLAEKMNRVPVSEYAKEFEAGLGVFENTAAGSKRMIESTRDLGTANWIIDQSPAKNSDDARSVRGGLSTGGRFYPSEGIAQAAEELAGAASGHTHYATHMLKLSRTHRRRAVEQETLETELEVDVIATYQDFLSAEATLFRSQRKNMEERRLDMDRALYVARGIKANHPKVFLAEAKRQVHMKAMEEIQATVDKLPLVFEKQLRAIAGCLIALRNYNAKNIQILTSTLFELGQDLPFPPPSPLPVLPPLKRSFKSTSQHTLLQSPLGT